MKALITLMLIIAICLGAWCSAVSLITDDDPNDMPEMTFMTTDDDPNDMPEMTFMTIDDDPNDKPE